MTQQGADAGSEPLVFELTRTFNAPRDLVFRLWTEGEHLAHWWLPRGTTMRVLREDRKSTRLNSSH